MSVNVNNNSNATDAGNTDNTDTISIDVTFKVDVEEETKPVFTKSDTLNPYLFTFPNQSSAEGITGKIIIIEKKQMEKK